MCRKRTASRWSTGNDSTSAATRIESSVRMVRRLGDEPLPATLRSTGSASLESWVTLTFRADGAFLSDDMHLNRLQGIMFDNTLKPRDKLAFRDAAKRGKISVRFQACLLHNVRSIHARIQGTVQMATSQDCQIRSISLQQLSQCLAIAVNGFAHNRLVTGRIHQFASPGVGREKGRHGRRMYSISNVLL